MVIMLFQSNNNQTIFLFVLSLALVLQLLHGVLVELPISVLETATPWIPSIVATDAFVVERTYGIPTSLSQQPMVAFHATTSLLPVSSPSSLLLQRNKKTVLYEQKPMKRPILDQIATTLFRLETNRVESSSIIDDKGRYGEPMEWSNTTSYANQFSVMIASNPIGYYFKQSIANLIAGDYNEAEITALINNYIQQDTVVMFSFTTCPFCRKAKDILDEQTIPYTAIELDTMDTDDDSNDKKNLGNIVRAQLGKLTKRTSMPNIFIHGNCIGGCNDGYPGLIPLIEKNQLQEYISSSSSLKN